MKLMKDLMEISMEIDPGITGLERKEKYCDLLLKEFAKMKGRDLAPYLVDCSIDLKEQPAQQLVIRFPFVAHPFNPFLCEIEGDGSDGV